MTSHGSPLIRFLGGFIMGLVASLVLLIIGRSFKKYMYTLFEEFNEYMWREYWNSRRQRDIARGLANEAERGWPRSVDQLNQAPREEEKKEDGNSLLVTLRTASLRVAVLHNRMDHLADRISEFASASKLTLDASASAT